jgi:hypothetical protein
LGVMRGVLEGVVEGVLEGVLVILEDIWIGGVVTEASTRTFECIRGKVIA